jgi:hypothetical protein
MYRRHSGAYLETGKNPSRGLSAKHSGVYEIEVKRRKTERTRADYICNPDDVL